MLKISKLTKTYFNSPVKAVDALDLELRPGEVFGFLGPNGAGKSTTIKSLVGILPYESGKITICDIDIAEHPKKAKMLIGYVPDNHAVFERLTGKEYINHIANLYGVSRADREQRAEELVNLFNLKKAYNNQIKSYSHGMKQKIAVIGALVHDPKLWVLDEPLTGLDPQSAFELKECIRKHAEKGNTVFFSSHILDVVEKICDRVAIIRKGKLYGIYDMKQMQIGELERLFLKVIKEEEET